MNELFYKAVHSFLSLPDSCCNKDLKKQWAKDNDLDISVYKNQEEIEAFFRIATKIGKDDKYVTDKFLVRHSPRVTVDSYFISLFKKYEIREVLVTVESNVYLVAALMALGYRAEPVTIPLTDKWGKDNYWAIQNNIEYGHGILLTSID